jgi:hypothetical protein
MKKQLRRAIIFSAAMAALVLTAAGSPNWAAQIPFSKAKIIFEYNFTARDLGIQISLDGEPWKEIKIVDPNGRTIFEVEGAGSLRNFGLTELFAESNEPNLEEVPKEDILARFPEGSYRFYGTTVEGDRLVGRARLTHNLPDGPEIVSPLEGDVVELNNTVIRWNAVTTPAGIKIAGYQVIVERLDGTRAFDVKLPATATAVTVPPEFLEPSTQYKFEVLAIEAGGNQTISEGGPFATP